MIVKILRYAAKRLEFYWYILGMLSKNTHIHPSCNIDNIKYVSIGKNVNIGKDCWIHCPSEHIKSDSTSKIIIIEDGVSIVSRAEIAGVSSVHIGKNVVMASNVYICDCSHKYDDITKPIISQGLDKIAAIYIGENSWIEINACILPGCKIGRNCVVGANSVVTKSFPDYCVIAGVPARIIKKYDQKRKVWDRVNQS